jgi:uncharacterized cupin superfamily protein
MRKVNVNDLEEFAWSSPKGKFSGRGKQVSEALGRDARSLNLLERHPFDVEIARLKPGETPFPYHSHSAQWEFYHVLSGSGTVRHEAGTTAIETGDAFIFKPGEAHGFFNDGSEDLVMVVVADNPIGESAHYPDSEKWAVGSPQSRVMRSDPLDYFDGEE